MPPALRIACGAFAALFLFGAAVQWNDPDPLRWMAAYLAAAGVSAGAAAGRPLPVATAVVLAGLVAFLVPWLPALQHGSPEALRSFGMSGAPEEEELREAWGLILLVSWTGFLLFRCLRLRGRPSAPARRPGEAGGA